MGNENIMKIISSEAETFWHEAKKPLDNFLKETSRKPADRLIKKNKFAGDSEYLEIGYLQAKLDQVYMGLWQWENIRVETMINGVCVYGDLKVFHPVAGVWLTRSGVGFKEFQLKSGMTEPSPANLSSKALQRDVPIAEAEGFKNACKKLGNVFGRHLNRNFKAEHQDDPNVMSRIFGDEKDEQV
jgi:hypothetical protein